MDWSSSILLFLVILVTQCNNRMVRCDITDVRLVTGPSSNKGTVELRQDNRTWETTCGVNLAVNDVILICRQLGFTGASRAMENTPYGQHSTPTKGLLCNEGIVDLSGCTLLPSSPCSTAGAASCHGEGYQGCFVDSVHDRVLLGEMVVNDPSMTISKCIQLCGESTTANYAYAGVEHGSECFCGEASDDYAQLGVGTDSNCQFPCSGDPTESCGGLDYIAVFSTSEPSSAASDMLEISSTDQVVMANNGSKSATPTPSVMSTTPEAPSAVPESGNDKGLYAGIGGGAVAFIIVIIIVIIFMIRRRSRNRRKNTFTQGMALDTSSRPTTINDHGVTRFLITTTIPEDAP